MANFLPVHEAGADGAYQNAAVPPAQRKCHEDMPSATGSPDGAEAYFTGRMRGIWNYPDFAAE